MSQAPEGHKQQCHSMQKNKRQMDLRNVKMASLDVWLSVSQDMNDFQETA